MRLKLLSAGRGRGRGRETSKRSYTGHRHSRRNGAADNDCPCHRWAAPGGYHAGRRTGESSMSVERQTRTHTHKHRERERERATTVHVYPLSLSLIFPLGRLDAAYWTIKIRLRCSFASWAHTRRRAAVSRQDLICSSEYIHMYIACIWDDAIWDRIS